MAAAAAASFETIGKTYKDSLRPSRSVAALRGVSFQIRTGEVFGLLGPNRAGKTTLIKILLTLCQPTEGKYTRLGQPGSDRSTLARVGYMHENQAFPRYLDATSLLHYYGALSLLREDDLAQRVPALLQRVGLGDRGHEPISRFSKGMVQRLALAQSLINDPELLVLDEPAEGLDLKGRQLIHEVIHEQKAKGCTVLLVSHVVADVEAICDRVAVIVEGKLKQVGPIADFNDKDTTFEQALQKLYEGK
jgi:ABC-2 type transport system ATP-binding protein